MKLIHRVTTVVRRIEDVCPGVRSLELADPDEWELPPFFAGSHIDVHLPSGRVRQYSLYGNPTDVTRYRIAVRYEEQGHGGSREIHDDIGVGSVIPVSLPRNHFPLADARHHLMIAGGIGITPFLSMIEVLRHRGDRFVLHYCSPTPEKTPFRSELASLAAEGLVRHYHSRAVGGRLNVAQLIAGVDPDTHVYCCGPTRLIESVQQAAPPLAQRLHFESFGAPVISDPAYEVELARSKRVVSVRASETMLQALREAGVDVPSSCEAGVCLECKTRFFRGTPIHRDLLMNRADRVNFITPCVSGCAGGRLVLDL